MCGHVGFAGEHKEADKIITFLLVLDSTRGTYGTGLFMTSLSKKGECLIKESGDCYNLINNKNYNVVNSSYNLFIGHNRASTRGHNTPSNSHPFNLGRIVGAHNGTLSNFYETSFLSMCEEKRHNSKYCIRGDVSYDSLKSKFDVLRDNTTSQFNSFRRSADRRYCALNVVDPILRFGSVEFRMFEGNLDIEKFKLWLSIVNKIGLISKSCSTKRHIIYLYNWLLLHRERYFKKTFKELKYSSDCNEDALIQISDLIEEGFL